jgi:hypothetical protein
MPRVTQVTVYLSSGEETAQLKLRSPGNDQHIPPWIQGVDRVTNYFHNTVWGYYDELTGSIGQRGKNTCWVHNVTNRTVNFLELLNYDGGGVEYSPESPAVAALLELESAQYDSATGAFSVMVPSTRRARGTSKYAGRVTWDATSRIF